MDAQPSQVPLRGLSRVRSHRSSRTIDRRIFKDMHLEDCVLHGCVEEHRVEHLDTKDDTDIESKVTDETTLIPDVKGKNGFKKTNILSFLF